MSSLLERSGRVRSEYAHLPKVARPHPILALEDALLKWYDVAPGDAPVPCHIRETACDAVCRGAALGTLDVAGDLGFVILHRCGGSFYFLLVSTWRHDNELWETVWAKDGAEASFEPWPVEGDHRPTFCVWELGVVCHEQRAWSSFLRSGRDQSSKRKYLLDSYSGPV